MEFKEDGTFRGIPSNEDSYTGNWKVNGNNIIITRNVLSTTFTEEGTIIEGTLNLSNTIWKKQGESIGGGRIDTVKPLEGHTMKYFEMFSECTDLYDQMRYNEAIGCYDELLLIYPNDGDAWNNKAVVLGGMGRYNEAMASCDKSIENQKEGSVGWKIALKTKCDIFYEQGKDEDAIACYDKVLEISPEDASVWRKRCQSIAGTGNEEEAKKCHNQEIS